MSRHPPLAALLFAASAAASAQQAAPFAHGDVKAGKALAERDCVTCHEQKWKPASAIYTRSDRRVKSAAQLVAQVQRCNAELGTRYFPEEEDNVAAFLNDAYYRFQK